jgi:hypothetical protein
LCSSKSGIETSMSRERGIMTLALLLLCAIRGLGRGPAASRCGHFEAMASRGFYTPLAPVIQDGGSTPDDANGYFADVAWACRWTTTARGTTPAPARAHRMKYRWH